MAALLVPCALVIGAYVGVGAFDHGYAGFNDLAGFNAYGRVAQFADCEQFTPPEGTERLCETTPAADRQGPFFYQFSPESPKNRLGLANDPESAEVLGRWARAALLAQPLDYAKAVSKDLARYAVPNLGADRPMSGTGPAQMAFGWTTPVQQAETREEIAAN